MNSHKQKGTVLIVAMVLLAVLTVLGTTTMDVSLLQVKIAGNFNQHAYAFQDAESGLNTAAFEYVSDPETIEASLPVTGTSKDATWLLRAWGGVRSFDTVLLATAISDKDGTTNHTFLKRVKIPAIVDGTIGIYDAGEIDLFGNVHIDGRDHEPPVAFDCNGSGCTPTLASPAAADIPAIYAESGTDYVTEHGSTSKDGATPLIKTGGGVLNAEIMLAFVETLKEFATAHNGSDWGTRDNPVIHVIDTPMIINGNVDSAGMLLITADGVVINGGYHHEGLIVVSSDTQVTFTLGGGADICGAIAVVGPNVEVNIGGSGTPNIVYCSGALNNANSASGVKRVGWFQEQ